MKPQKLPKSVGACADLYYETRQRRLAADKAAAELKAEEERIKNHIIDNLDKREESGAAGKHHRVQIVRKRKYRVNPEKWGAFFSWVAKNKAWDVLQKRLSDQAIKDRVEQGKTKVPGLEPFDYVDVSLTKV